METAGTTKTQRRPKKTPRAFFRWPPVGATVAGAGAASSFPEEEETLPMPFLSRELRVGQEDWLAYLRYSAPHLRLAVQLRSCQLPNYRQHTRFGRQDAMNSTVARRAAGAKELPTADDVDLEVAAIGRDRPVTPRVPRMWMIHPISKLALAWRVIITLLDASYSAFLIPISCAFHWNVKYFSWYNAIDSAAGVVFWADVVMGFSTGFVVVYNLKRLVVLDRRLVAEFYVFRSTFVCDLLAALPIIAEVTVLCIPNTGGQTSLHVIFLLRLARMFRVYQMIAWLIKISLAGTINRLISRVLSAGQMFLVSLLYAGLVTLNLLTCFWYYVASWEGLSHSWLVSVGPTSQDISGENSVRQYVAAFHFITATVTTTGYGDIAPVSAAEEICAAFIMLFGVVMFGFIISGSQELVQYLAPEARTLRLLRIKMEQVDIWAAKRRISPKLLARCNTYFTEVWLQSAELQQSTVFSELPAVLQAEVCSELTQEVFANSGVFDVLDDKSKMVIASRLKPRSIPAGHDLCKEGDLADCLWIVEEGEVLAVRHGAELELLEAPAILGETAVLAGTVPTCRARPYTLRAEDMDYMFKLHPELLERLLDSFKSHLRRLMDLNSGLRDSPWAEVLHSVDTAGAAAGRAGPRRGVRLTATGEEDQPHTPHARFVCGCRQLSPGRGHLQQEALAEHSARLFHEVQVKAAMQEAETLLTEQRLGNELQEASDCTRHADGRDQH